MPNIPFNLLHTQGATFIVSPSHGVKIRVFNLQEEEYEPDLDELKLTAHAPWDHLVFQTVNWDQSKIEYIIWGLDWYAELLGEPRMEVMVLGAQSSE